MEESMQVTAATTAAALDDSTLYITASSAGLNSIAVTGRGTGSARCSAGTLKFLAIFSSNLDEFFMSAWAACNKKVQARIAQGSGADRIAARRTGRAHQLDGSRNGCAAVPLPYARMPARS